MSSIRALLRRAAAPLLALSATACTYDYDAPFRCSNGALDGDEIDVDCGGSCDACGLGRACVQDTDCAVGGCRKGACAYEPVPYWSALPAGPPARWGAAMARVGVGKLVLFSGINDNDAGTAPYGDTWEFDGEKWAEKNTASSPDGQAYAPMAFDETLARVLLLNIEGETWSYGTGGWKLESSGDPGRRLTTCMGYDGVAQKMFLYGGVAPNDVLTNDVRARPSTPGSTWSKAADGPSSGGRWEVAGAFDTARRKLLAFGGELNDEFSAHVVEYDVIDKTWTSVKGPSARSGAAAAYDEEREVLVVWGGGINPPARDDLWEYGADGWREIEPRGTKPPGLFFASMAYDPKHHRTVLYGGATAIGSNGGTNKTYSYSVLATNCTSGDQCGTNHCVDGVCCADPQCAEGFACNLPADPGFCVAKAP